MNIYARRLYASDQVAVWRDAQVEHYGHSTPSTYVRRAGRR